MNIKQVLKRSEEYLNKHSVPQPRLDAEVLLADLLDMERIKLYVNYDYPLKPEELDKYRERISMRGKRIPVAYITGFKEFMSLELKVNQEVLLPRPETELLVEEIIDYCKENNLEQPNIVDVGTGSGAIMVSLGYYLEGARVLGIDISKAAVQTARENIEQYDLGERLKVIQGDLLEPLLKMGKDNVDIVVSNPPYISKEEMEELQPEVKAEPRLALEGGTGGLEIYRQLIPQSRKVLQDEGLLILEFGQNQAQSLENMFSGWEQVKVKKDYAGHKRIISALKPANKDTEGLD
ncbi:MAG: peptide chain release factor N(5)-glutamine methyltransferase [Bacillota bacterium]